MINNTHLTDDVNCTHDQLIKMAILKKIDVVDDAVLKAGPDLGAKLGVNVEPITKIPQTNACQVIQLQEKQSENKTENMPMYAEYSHTNSNQIFFINF